MYIFPIPWIINPTSSSCNSLVTQSRSTHNYRNNRQNRQTSGFSEAAHLFNHSVSSLDHSTAPPDQNVFDPKTPLVDYYYVQNVVRHFELSCNIKRLLLPHQRRCPKVRRWRTNTCEREVPHDELPPYCELFLHPTPTCMRNQKVSGSGRSCDAVGGSGGVAICYFTCTCATRTCYLFFDVVGWCLK